MAKHDNLEKDTRLSSVAARMVSAAAGILQEPPSKPDYLHSVLCQAGLPRSRAKGRTFERTNGDVSLLIKAGELWDGRQWVVQPLPYGTRPRLALIHLCSEAVRTGRPEVEVGASTREFLIRLGVDTGGKGYTTFQQQMRALAACEMRFGARGDTLRVQPIDDFRAWHHPTGEQRSLWPGVIRLTDRFFQSLQSKAVPLDPRALSALSDSALALDVYAWAAQRLHRVRSAEGQKIRWASLKAQFGQEYADLRNFKRKLREALTRVCGVYPDARIENMRDGLLLLPSKPPVLKTSVLSISL